MEAEPPSSKHAENADSTVPVDFPMHEHFGLVSGTQPKLLLKHHAINSIRPAVPRMSATDGGAGVKLLGG